MEKKQSGMKRLIKIGLKDLIPPGREVDILKDCVFCGIRAHHVNLVDPAAEEVQLGACR